MHYYKAIFQYDGSDYFGFQWQKDIPSVQNDINQALASLLSGKITTVGASRTDTGVHALEQIVKITTENPIALNNFLEQFNHTLPPQIRCLSLLPCEGSFNPIKGNKTKEYRYLFTTTLRSNCEDQKYVANYPYIVDLGLMNECVQQIVGTHDFHNFCSAGSNVKTTVREIIHCAISEVDPHEVLQRNPIFPMPGDFRKCYQLKIEGTGFLKQMVRHLMSSLWLVGRGKMTAEEFAHLLKGPTKSKRLWKVADPRGLYLVRFNH